MNAIPDRVTTPSAATNEAPDQAALLAEIINRVDHLAVQQSRPSPVALRSWEDIERFAAKAARSGMVPKDYIGKPDAICIAVQMGSELGLAPMQALQNIAVINGRPAIWGDAMPGLCRASGKCLYIREWHEGDGETLVYFCEARRKDDPNPVIGRFGVVEAKKAGLWGKDLYTKYPQRMLLARARGFTLRDAFPDVLKGLISAEEARDIPFDATGLVPTMPAETAGDAIGDAIPERVMDAPQQTAKPKQTIAQWLDALQDRLADAQTREAVDAIVAEPEVQRALDGFRNGARERLETMLREAERRTDPDDFPGDRVPKYEQEQGA